MDDSFPVPLEIELGLKLPCWLCGDACHMVADTNLDEWDWVDDSGNKFGKDTDLRPLYANGGNPYAYLADLDKALQAAMKAVGGPHGKKGSFTPLYWAKTREYGALKVRLEFGGTFHIHHVRTDSVPPWKGELPYCCGSPAWLRPSGWHCRECRRVIELRDRRAAAKRSLERMLP